MALVLSRFDEDMIESLFGYNLHNTNEDLKSKSPSPSKHVLDPKRLQNLTILLKALNATTEQVCRALVQGKDPSYSTQLLLSDTQQIRYIILSFIS